MASAETAFSQQRTSGSSVVDVPTSKDNEDEEKVTEAMKKEAEHVAAEIDKVEAMPLRIVMLRILVFVMLALLAGLLGYYVYKISKDSEQSQFESTFDASAAQLQRGFPVSYMFVSKNLIQ